MKLKELEDHLSRVRGGDRIFQRLSAVTNDQFVAALYGDIDTIFTAIEANPELRQTDSEDRLTVEILVAIKQLGYIANHEAKHGGKVDLLVEHATKEFKWLGEAKIYTDVGDLRQGFNQLTTRYTNGSGQFNHGGLLAYLRRPNPADQMARWREELLSLELKELTTEDCPVRTGTSFYSTHTHAASGRAFRTRHMCLMLYFSPQDRA